MRDSFVRQQAAIMQSYSNNNVDIELHDFLSPSNLAQENSTSIFNVGEIGAELQQAETNSEQVNLVATDNLHLTFLDPNELNVDQMDSF